MRISVLYKIALVLSVSLACSHMQAFAYTGRELKDSVKSEYLVLTVSAGLLESVMLIEYTDGRTEDFLQINKIKNRDLVDHERHYILMAFKYLDELGYELQSSLYVSYGETKGYREYYFVKRMK